MTDEQRSQTGWIGVQEWVVIFARALSGSMGGTSVARLRRRQKNFEARPATVGGKASNRSSMALGNLAHEREPEPHARICLAAIARRAVEGLEDPLAFLGGHTRPGIGHSQSHFPTGAFAHIHFDGTVARVALSVFQQIADHAPQHARLAMNPQRLSCDLCSGSSRFLRRQRQEIHVLVARELVDAVNPNRKIFEARKRETAALGAGEKLVLGHPLAATIGDSARCMQNLEKVLFTGPKTSDTVTFICD